jgi:chromosome segregation ATPase
MALSDDDLEKLGKLIENAAERRHQEIRAELLAIQQDFHAQQVALVQEMQAMEQRLNARIDGVEQRLDARIDGVEQRLDARIDGVQAEIRSVRATLLDMQRILNDHGGILNQVYDGLTTLYKRENVLEMRVEHLEALYRQRFPPPQTP